MSFGSPEISASTIGPRVSTVHVIRGLGSLISAHRGSIARLLYFDCPLLIPIRPRAGGRALARLQICVYLGSRRRCGLVSCELVSASSGVSGICSAGLTQRGHPVRRGKPVVKFQYVSAP
jgi:hypothetical protein